MIQFSLTSFINTLIKTVNGSPTSVLFIILGIIFIIAMIINLKKSKTIGRSLYICSWVFIVVFVTIKYYDYLSKLFDNLINSIFKQIFFPSLSTYVIVIIANNIIFLYTILNKKTKLSDKLINSTFFLIITIFMFHALDVIIKNNINVYNQNEVYTNQMLLVLIEATTIIFTIWMLFILSKQLLRILIEQSNDKIIENEKNKIEIEEKSIENNNHLPDYSVDLNDEILDYNSNNNLPNKQLNTTIENINDNISFKEQSNDIINNQNIVDTNNLVLENYDNEPSIEIKPEYNVEIEQNPESNIENLLPKNDSLVYEFNDYDLPLNSDLDITLTEN